MVSFYYETSLNIDEAQCQSLRFRNLGLKLVFRSILFGLKKI